MVEGIKDMMKHIPHRIAAVALAALCIVTMFPAAAFAASEWNISNDTEIYWVETANSTIDNADLKAQVQLFAQEMQAKGITQSTLGISYGAQELAGDNDIVLLLDASLGIAAEGYQISINGGQLCVKASDADGLFYGCRFVEQALLTGTGLNKANGVTVKPDYPERAFFLDCGRKYYSPDWIKDMIREISWSNMNAIYIHFSEEMGFRLESKTYPWLAGGDNTLCIGGASYGVAADNGKYITQDEMREIAAVAKLYHVEIIPSLDSPGHMNYAVKKYNAKYGTDIGNYYHYNGKTAIVQGSGPEAAQKNYSRGIDISNTEAVTFAKNLYAEYAAFFKELGCTKFDIGGDELLGWGTSLASSVSKWEQLDHWKTYAQRRSGNENAVAYDAFMYYMNDIYDLVKGYGYTSIRMWNDDALRSADTDWNKVVTLNPGMEIQYWTPAANNSKNNIWTYLNAGYKAYNFLNEYNYYVLGQAHDGSGYKGITPQRIYENWAPNIFIPYGGTGSNTAIGNANVKGSAFCVWCDKPSTESAATVKAGIIPCLRVNGAKAWDADLNSTVSYSSAQKLLKLIGDAPTNLPTAPEVKQYIAPDMTALKAVIAEYEATDPTLYTEQSFANYTAAVNSGRAVLAAKKPTQVDVDNAVAVINDAKAALELLVTVDFTALDEELSLFDSTIGADYTVETYTAYKVYAENAHILRNSEEPSQEAVNAAAGRLAYLRSQLRGADKIAFEDEDWFLSLAVKSNKALQGKLFTFTAYVRIDANIVAYEVYDENGQRVEPKNVTFANKAYVKGNRDGVQIRINAEVKGKHTYTFYAVNADGVRSPDSRSIDVIVR
ncbi:MAG: family 20 glycosylhydrolase [Christensenellaceae bacterium]|nr:family 20 glycosylhydrolase [Christensenellaceae bacterium]